MHSAAATCLESSLSDKGYSLTGALPCALVSINFCIICGLDNDWHFAAIKAQAAMEATAMPWRVGVYSSVTPNIFQL